MENPQDETWRRVTCGKQGGRRGLNGSLRDSWLWYYLTIQPKKLKLIGGLAYVYLRPPKVPCLFNVGLSHSPTSLINYKILAWCIVFLCYLTSQEKELCGNYVSLYLFLMDNLNCHLQGMYLYFGSMFLSSSVACGSYILFLFVDHFFLFEEKWKMMNF